MMASPGQLRTTDNNGGVCKIPTKQQYDDLSGIGNRNVRDLCDKNPDLLVFPQTLGVYEDGIEDSCVFSLQEDYCLRTRNMMGFVGRNGTQLTISSRFAKTDKNDYFLHYMLQKVFAVNIFNFDQTSNDENVWDFLLYLFPYFLKRAYAQGIYRTYLRRSYNDSNVRGTINVNRHIRLNVPFQGKVAYSVRERSYDNSVTQLIRHTIEHIKSHPYGEGVLSSDSETRDIVNKMCEITQGSYRKNNRQRVISENLKTVAHPYFTEYGPLQKICLRILRREKLTFGEREDKIYGLLFDGAWLWEEYINTILKNDFDHPRNIAGTGGKLLFERNGSRFQRIYPDFISKKKPCVVGDTKYIPLERNEYSEDSERATSIYYKTITYMYRLNSSCGLLLFPHPKDSLRKDTFSETYNIIGTDGKLWKIGLTIPQEAIDFADFKAQIGESENQLKNTVQLAMGR